MTAQQQLAELIRKFPRDDQWDVDACVFIRDHGPAIAELIASFAEEEHVREEIRQYEFNEDSRPDGYDEGHATSLRESLTAIKRKRQRILAALTEPK